MIKARKKPAANVRNPLQDLQTAFLIGAARSHYKTRRKQLQAIKAAGLTVADLRAIPTSQTRRLNIALNVCLPFAGLGFGAVAVALYHLILHKP